MPQNSKGKFFPNFQQARASDAMDTAKISPLPDKQTKDDTMLPAHKVEVHKHDDETFHTITNHDDGTRTREEHPDLESVKTHLDVMKPQADMGMEDPGDHEYR
jgi:hypothetical protein